MAILMKQRDIADCGATCLASIAGHYKMSVSVAQIRQLAGTDKQGTNVLGLVEAATSLNFEAKGVKGNLESLAKIPLPAIAHVLINKKLEHYVVIDKIKNSSVEIMDPADGKIHRISFDAFSNMWSGILVLMLPSDNFVETEKKNEYWSRFLKLLKPHKAIVFQALFGALIYTILGLSTSIFVQKITDYVLVDNNRNLLNLMSIIMIGVLLFQIFVGTVKSIFTLRSGQEIDCVLILGYYKHLLKLPQKFFDTMRIGEIISRVNDAVKIRTFINDVAIALIVNIFIVVLSFVLMFTYYWKLAFIMLTALPLYMIVYFITRRINQKLQRRLMEQSAEVESQLVESLNSVGTIKIFGLENYTHDKTETKFIRLLNTVYKSGINSVYSASTSELISRLLTIVMLWIGAGYVMDGDITPGELFSFYTLVGYFMGPIASLISSNKVVQDAVIATERLFEIMDLELEVDNSTPISPNELSVGYIRFEDVKFSYSNRKTIFDRLNLTIKLGSYTAIVGNSGSGKSTLVSLLHNLYQIESGNILIGKNPIKYLSNRTLRNAIGVVPQEVYLFAGNVIENIAVGDYSPDMERIIDICRELGILDFIEGLPQGFQSYLGENGALLSGGQKQRIAIARTLYLNPEILIMDEATSSLDPVSEKYVQETINRLIMRKKTVIVIAHRLTTIKRAHNIIVLDKGQVVEIGSHDELVSAHGNYNILWNKQFE